MSETIDHEEVRALAEERLKSDCAQQYGCGDYYCQCEVEFARAYLALGTVLDQTVDAWRKADLERAESREPLKARVAELEAEVARLNRMVEVYRDERDIFHDQEARQRARAEKAEAALAWAEDSARRLASEAAADHGRAEKAEQRVRNLEEARAREGQHDNRCLDGFLEVTAALRSCEAEYEAAFARAQTAEARVEKLDVLFNDAAKRARDESERADRLATQNRKMSDRVERYAAALREIADEIDGVASIDDMATLRAVTIVAASRATIALRDEGAR